MALGGKKKEVKKSSGEKKYVNIMQVCMGQGFEGKEPKEYLKANDYKGRLIWHEYGGENGDDPTTGTYYEIKTAFIGDPHEKSPDFVLQNVVVNLANEKAAVRMNTESDE